MEMQFWERVGLTVWVISHLEMPSFRLLVESGPVTFSQSKPLHKIAGGIK